MPDTSVGEPAAGEESASVHSGMGPLVHGQGVAFRVWAPNADRVAIIGTFNEWDALRNPMRAEPNGCWYLDLPEAKIGDEYKYRIFRGKQYFDRIDPRVRQVTNSIGNGVIHDPEFDWADDQFQIAAWNELVIYEMHVGTFQRSDDDRPGTFDDIVQRLPHLQRLGVNALQIMPSAEFAGDLSWGYNPAHMFAVESAYGGPRAFKQFVKDAHAAGFAIIMDVVYNHFGPSDLGLWQFDGWSENDKGGIYFYNDWRSATPWGDTRPDYGRGEVRTFILDNALMWMEEYHVDGLRFDMTLYLRSVDGTPNTDLPDGWSLMRWVNREIHTRDPRAITIAEDLQNKDYLTKREEVDGAGFSSQWDAGFVHPIRDVLTQVDDAQRSMPKVRDALLHRYNGDAFQRVVYTESHDEVANGKSRVPDEVSPNNEDWYAQKRSTLGAALAMTAPGIPMLFQGQEFLQGGYFQDTEGLDWDNNEQFRGIVRLYADLIRLRRNLDGTTRGLCGQGIDVFHVNDSDKVIAFARWETKEPRDTVLVLANFSSRSFTGYRIGLPAGGLWKVVFNSDSDWYSRDFEGFPIEDFEAEPLAYDGQEYSGTTRIGPYSLAIFSLSVADPQ